MFEKEIARITAAQRQASTALVKQALADALNIAKQSQGTAPPCNHAGQIRALKDEVDRLQAAAQSTGGKHPKRPCPTCGELMRADKVAEGCECRACYNTKNEARRTALAVAVARVNADPQRPHTVAGCLHAVAELAGIAPGSVRELMARCLLTVKPNERKP
jgi:hypothetical protein